MTRHVPLEGVENFRDFGGYDTVAGGRLRRGLLFRSASHGRATDADLAAIAALNIAVVVDLRRKGERERDPSRRPGGFAGEVIVNNTGEDEEDTWIAHISRSDLTEASFRDYMFDYYRKAPFDPRHLDLYARYFEALERGDGPVLIHCAAGKDRTGLLAALTHHLAGVHPDDALADYLLTNDPVRMARRLPQVMDVIAAIAGRAPSEAVVRVVMAVEADYLATALAAIVAQYGDLDVYLEKGLGVDADRREAIRAKLLE
jgi:protein tyrosine/serine phosphatase